MEAGMVASWWGARPSAGVGLGLGAGFAAVFALGCAAGEKTVEAPPAKEPASVEVQTPPPLDAEESAARARLDEWQGELARAVPRGKAHAWEMADAADRLAAAVEALGYPIVREAYEIEGSSFFNLTLRSFGTAERDEVIVVGAPYDLGSDGSALPAALLLELAHHLREHEHRKSVELVWFALGQGSDVAEAERGAAHYLAREAARRAQVDDLTKNDAVMRARGELIEGTPELDVDRSEAMLFLSLGELEGFASVGRVSMTTSVSERAGANPDRATKAGRASDARGALESALGYLSFGELKAGPDAQLFSRAGVPSITLAAVAAPGHRTNQESPSELEARLAVRLSRAVLEIAGTRSQLENLYLQD